MLRQLREIRKKLEEKLKPNRTDILTLYGEVHGLAIRELQTVVERPIWDTAVWSAAAGSLALSCDFAGY